MGSKRKPRRPPAPRNRRDGPKPPSPQKVARILVDADLHGDAYAAQQHNVSERSVIRYRQRYGSAPDVAGLVTEIRTRLTTGWEEQLLAVQKELTVLVLQGARSPEASLRDRTDALRRVSELRMSKVLLGPDDDERTDDHQRRDPATPRREGPGGEGPREGRAAPTRGGRGESEDAED